MASNNMMILDDEALERPPYVGIQKRGLTHEASTPSKKTPSTTRTPSNPESLSPLKPRHRQASAYMHLPVTQPVTQVQPSDRPQPAANASQAPSLWHVPPQQVCKNGATPTNVCGKWSKAENDPPKKPNTRGGTGPFKCPRCKFGYSRIDSVRQHFPHCIKTNGNPDCDAWTDDDSYADGVADRNATRTDSKDTAKERKPRNKAAHLVNLTACEFVIRLTTHGTSGLFDLEHSSGEAPSVVETEEEKDKAWKAISKNLKEDTRDAQKLSPEAACVIGLFKEDGLWDSDASDEA